MFKIEKGIKPVRSSEGGYWGNVPIGDMEVGDSVFLEGYKISTVSACMKNYFAKHPKKRFCCRTVDGGTRIFRTI